MSAHGNSYYTELHNEIFDEPYLSNLSTGAKWLFAVLKRLEQRLYPDNKSHEFYRTDSDLLKDTGIKNIKTIQSYKKELQRKASNLIRIEYKPVFNPATGKFYKNKVTHYKFLI